MAIVMRNIYLIPGFTASDLAVESNGHIIWWRPNLVMLDGIGLLRLAPNGVDPGPPDGVSMLSIRPAQYPWETIKDILTLQLDPRVWALATSPYDWRKDLRTWGDEIANNIRATSSAAQPATLVGHSAGGLVAIAAWANLFATSEQNLIRRIITICSPFQGSYLPISWLTGVLPSAQQLLAVLPLSQWNPLVPKALWTLQFINGVALTWPAFYQLFPGVWGSEALRDPNRHLLYTATNYRAGAQPSQAWLGHSLNVWQTFIQSPATFPPSWVLTCVYGDNLATWSTLLSDRVPLQLGDLGLTTDGDGVVTKGSAIRAGGVAVGVTGTHATIPLGITLTGLLAKLIVDPRGPPDPPPPNQVIRLALQDLIQDPPTSDPISGLQCIGGG